MTTNTFRYTPFVLAALLAAGSASLVLGEDRPRSSDADVVREAVQRGAILQLADILSRLQGKLDGRVIEVELDRENGRVVYEIKVLSEAGVVTEYDVDAATAEIVKSKTKKR